MIAIQRSREISGETPNTVRAAGPVPGEETLPPCDLVKLAGEAVVDAPTAPDCAPVTWSWPDTNEKPSPGLKVVLTGCPATVPTMCTCGPTLSPNVPTPAEPVSVWIFASNFCSCGR